MHKCSNCSTEFSADHEGLLLTALNVTTAAICGDCCKGVRTAKLVIKKGDVGVFRYEQWSQLEMMSGGLTSKKAG